MIKYMFSLAFILLFLSSCSPEEEEEDYQDNNNVNDEHSITDNDISDNNTADENNFSDDFEKPDEPESFCYSGGAILFENDVQFKTCPGDDKKVQKQLCKNGKWVDDGDCISSTVLIPEGTFEMGCDLSKEGHCEEDNTPMHQPVLSEYFIDLFEVNVERYEACIAAGSCNNNNSEEPHYRNSEDSYSCNLGNSERKNHPANCVTWYGAKAFCEWIEMRLPTEAEWEKAARGSTLKIYPWGDTPLPDCDHAIIKTASAGCGYSVTFPIGTAIKGVSQFGLYDTAGNVFEYVSDWYKKDFYSSTAASEKDVSGPSEPGFDNFRITRGGSYLYDERRARTAFRSACKMDDPAIDFGFRCASDKK